MKQTIRAERLKPGDTIGLVAPSHIVKPGSYDHIIEVLTRFGYRVKTGNNLYATTYGYSATEHERADDFNQMIHDDEVKMIFFGGGECGNELMPYLDYDALRRQPKILMSYSDGTSILNAVNSKTGLVVYYGQGLSQFDDLRYFDYMHFCDNAAAGAERPEYFRRDMKWMTCNPGYGEGILIGGYLRNFTLMLGGEFREYDKNEDYILFIEDHRKFSAPDTVSGFLSYLEQSEFMNHVRGFLFGHYSTDEFSEVYARIGRLGAARGIPAVYCDDFGHGKNHGVLPIGERAALDGDGARLKFLS